MTWTDPRAALAAPQLTGELPATPAATPDVAAWYRDQFSFVWRSLRRLGVSGAALDDCAQEVFLVAHRRLADFEQGGSARAWLFGIARRVAQQARRSQRPQQAFEERAHAAPELDPQAAALAAEAADLVHRCLAMLDEDKRCVIILADMEQLSGPEVAQALDINLNTMYARLRAARKLFTAAVRRERARERG
jgi:RNA polymerase sigma-70 factor (ECF subfamily)